MAAGSDGRWWNSSTSLVLTYWHQNLKTNPSRLSLTNTSLMLATTELDGLFKKWPRSWTQRPTSDVERWASGWSGRRFREKSVVVKAATTLMKKIKSRSWLFLWSLGSADCLKLVYHVCNLSEQQLDLVSCQVLLCWRVTSECKVLHITSYYLLRMTHFFTDVSFTVCATETNGRKSQQEVRK